jgi:hypothetical protein
VQPPRSLDHTPVFQVGLSGIKLMYFYRTLFPTSISFDLSVYECFVPLSHDRPGSKSGGGHCSDRPRNVCLLVGPRPSCRASVTRAGRDNESGYWLLPDMRYALAAHCRSECGS